MPPSKCSAPAAKPTKAEQKKKAKIVDDKTFGMKNKKGAQTQKVIAQMKKQTEGSAKDARALPVPVKSKKELEKEKQAELATIFKPVAQTINSKVDPKSVLCMFFKQGLCTKGEKCKFSHDLAVEKKAEKRNIYHDERDENEDNMEDWDEAKLEAVVQEKHGEAEKAKLKTAIICKYFLQAVEDCKYGWFWACPNGNDKCLYRHALPSGYVLAKDRKKKDDNEERITLEELIERERAALGNDLTKVTWQSFRQWKERKRKEKQARDETELEKKKIDFQAGRSGALSGRELFAFNPNLVSADDDAEAVDSSAYMREAQEGDEGIVVKEWTQAALEDEGEHDRADEGTGTISTSSRRVGAPYAGAAASSATMTNKSRMPRDQTADYRLEDENNDNAEDAESTNENGQEETGDTEEEEDESDSEEEYERLNLDEIDMEFFAKEPDDAITQAMEELAAYGSGDIDDDDDVD